MNEESRVTSGVRHCACLGKDRLSKLAITVGKMLPEGSWLDAHHVDHGRRQGILAELNGKAALLVWYYDNVPKPEDIATFLNERLVA